MDRNFLAKFGESNNIDSILDRSKSATCGVMEREINVKIENVAKTKAALRSKGFVIIGTSEPNGRFRKIWYIRSGGF